MEGVRLGQRTTRRRSTYSLAEGQPELEFYVDCDVLVKQRACELEEGERNLRR